ncbi:hypothetical protein AGMMS49574_08020 [Bacteroidia bacterium]|nr:hypothetical protein AGMMS49574_08020 [Bacteroidia bacterium]
MLIPSCLGGDDQTDLTNYKDAQIASLSLSHDSVKVLASAKFTIDQVNGLIYNMDSLPYGTTFDKVICKITYASGVRGTLVIPEATGDSLWWNGTDSLDFSKPVRFTLTAYDGFTTKTYIARVNIHQIKSDSMVWTRYASPLTGMSADEQRVILHTYKEKAAYLMYQKASGKTSLFYSPVADAAKWTELSLTGFPDGADISQITISDETVYVSAGGRLYNSIDGLTWVEVAGAPVVKALLGTLRVERDREALLSAIIETSGVLTFAAMDVKGEWTNGDAVPANFPVSGFGSVNYSRMNHEYLMLAAGKDKNGGLLNTIWATMNAANWTVLTNPGSDSFGKKEGVVITQYDDMFYLTGGINADGKASKEVFTSKDNGITWLQADSLITFPENFAARGYASIQVDEATNYMLLFGGKTSKSTKHLDELWRGRINRLAK